MVGSGIRDKQTKFINSLYTKIGRIRDRVLFNPPNPGSVSGMEQWLDPDPGSGIKHHGSATLGDRLRKEMIRVQFIVRSFLKDDIEMNVNTGIVFKS
jgi:hypothetical protein